MNADTVQLMARATLTGERPFPEIVGKLIAEGVEYYRVDYLARQMSFYSAAASMVIAPQAVAADFDAPALRAAILNSQRHGQHFRAFSQRAVRAGVQGQFAFLRAQCVT